MRMDFAAVAELCAPEVATDTLRRIASVESSFNPYAIGVVGGHLQRQPRNLSEALATTQSLDSQGYDYSLGLLQINQKNFARYGVTPESAFDPCSNLRVGSLIFQDCLNRAGVGNRRLGDALSCYYSGNFTSGYRLGYVAKVTATAPDLDGLSGGVIPVVANRKMSKVRAVGKIRQSIPDPLFVGVSAPAETQTVGANNVNSPTKSRGTALLF